MTSLPPVYSFPPMYTRQPNSLIRRQQINSWIDIITQFCEGRKCWSMNAEGKPIYEDHSNVTNEDKKLFTNVELQRTVPQVFVDEIWTQMCQDGKALRYEDGKNSSMYYILWNSLDLWASLILQWFETSVKLNQVVTLYELSQGDETINWEFHGMPELLLVKCLKPLCNRNRATILKDDNGKPVGVKVI
ncbi:hypothetical protein Kpol_1028p98 [Vanderwaltozyma polyspora DSM 70294]|uniref:ESCRT-II complex subunit VPS25 n=1 Tax=Vanderwaltozyma polyspora (strain ATCC 22028 / DSM 70294 / BCRC 21397 / CBS 2163 / NBRC 10782 / NRRL Y-8283 / UCD 57-17) TaxID=436907 RepID=A7TG65_VANPO|nr:uncharacterized protein Kpol_1028p98 [Vanderwaltozyma polyspora DSM 70294]EDO18822.1 hypothetical protein Kpol_1028p98 [Vanderwaltozyma polyspora DSM 70294]